jgi:hypothetical protein
LFHHYNTKCLPPPESGIDIGCDDRFFRREAPKKELKKRKKLGITYTAGLSAGQVVGVNSFKLIVNEIAREVGLDNPDRQTSASLRSEHICTLVNAEDTIDSNVVMSSSRHKSDAAHKVYKRNSQAQLDKKTKAFHAEKTKRPMKVSIFHFYCVFIFNTILFLTLIICISKRQKRGVRIR